MNNECGKLKKMMTKNSGLRREINEILQLTKEWAEVITEKRLKKNPNITKMKKYFFKSLTKYDPF